MRRPERRLLCSQPKLRSHAWSLMKHAIEWQTLTYRIAMSARSDRDVVGIASEDYLLYGGYVTLAHHWLKMEEKAVAALEGGGSEDGEEADFLKAKISTSDFVFQNILPRTSTLKQTMLAPKESLMAMTPDQFSFDHAQA